MPRTKQELRQSPTALRPRRSLVQLASSEAEEESESKMPKKVRTKKHNEAQVDLDDWVAQATNSPATVTVKRKRKRSSSKSVTSANIYRAVF